jgi:hypothetical protein
MKNGFKKMELASHLSGESFSSSQGIMLLPSSGITQSSSSLHQAFQEPSLSKLYAMANAFMPRP